MPTLAIFSPNQNAYSETFVQAHKDLPFDIRFYYGGWLPLAMEGKSMMQLPWNLRIKKKLLKGFSNEEKKLMFSLVNEKADVALAEYGPSAVHTLQVLSYLKLPLVVHFHGFDASLHETLKNYENGYKQVFDYAYGVIVVSQRMKRDLIQMGCDESKIILNPCGPSDNFFEITPDYHSRTFISIGRFVQKKAPHLTILAFQKVVKEYPDAQLKMIGDGMFLETCKDLAIQLGLANNIEFLGVQLPSRVQSEMEHSIAFVQHSITAPDGDSEGTPVAVLEAQAAALPVIATRHAGIPDVVLHEKTGLLCDEKDVDGMAANIIRILKEDGLAPKLGQAGRQRIKDHFTMERHLGILTEVIQRAARGKARPSRFSSATEPGKTLKV